MATRGSVLLLLAGTLPGCSAKNAANDGPLEGPPYMCHCECDMCVNACEEVERQTFPMVACAESEEAAPARCQQACERLGEDCISEVLLLLEDEDDCAVLPELE
jgi:hypothetical protein